MIFLRAALLQTQHFLTRSHAVFLRRMHFPVLIYFFVVSRHDRVPVSRLGARGFSTTLILRLNQCKIRDVGRSEGYLNFPALRWARSPRRPTLVRVAPVLVVALLSSRKAFMKFEFSRTSRRTFALSLGSFLVKRGGVKKFPSLNRSQPAKCTYSSPMKRSKSLKID